VLRKGVSKKKVGREKNENKKIIIKKFTIFIYLNVFLKNYILKDIL